MALAPTTSSTAPLVAAAACNSGQPVAPLIAAAPALAEHQIKAWKAPC